jgi:tetratricopeptide (TPR) repeat protein
MLRLSRILIAIGSPVVVWAQAPASIPPSNQSPAELSLPKVKNQGFDPKTVANNVVNMYRNPHEAALAAFQAATQEKKATRAMYLMILALRRETGVAPALFGMGILCAQGGRWRDAVDFLREARKQAAGNADLADTAAVEADRLEIVERLESTPQGRKRREFDKALLPASKSGKDAFAALRAAEQLSKIDGTRWEAPALAGMSHADLQQFADSLAELEKAARLADRSHAAQLKSAVEIARKEATYKQAVITADGLSEKHQYEQAGQLYDKAWQESPGHWDTATDAATSYLMADQVDSAVTVLSAMRESAPPALGAKALALLKQLGAVSLDARRAAELGPAAESAQPASPAARIRQFVGSLTTAEMEVSVRPEPALLTDKTYITPMPDPEINSGSSDLMLLSTQSVFAFYQSGLPPAQPAPDAAAPAPPQSPPPAPPAPSAALHPPGAGQPVEIRTTPPGAAVLVDESEPCVSPCATNLSAGRHTLFVTLAGYRERRKIFDVERSKLPPPVELTLEAKHGSLTVSSDVPGAPIFLNGEKTGKITPASFPLNEGSYEVAVEIAAKRSVKRVHIMDDSFAQVRF